MNFLFALLFLLGLYFIITSIYQVVVVNGSTNITHLNAISIGVGVLLVIFTFRNI